MNRQYMGDALDYWKGSVFEYLQREQVLRNFLVDPMATDASEWNRDGSNLFARLLRIEETRLVHHTRDLCKDRKQYLSEIPAVGDLFLDPDTGIKTGYVRQLEKYLLPSEIFEVMETEENRMIAVYQHVRAKKTRSRLEEVVTTLKEQKRPFSCSSYESGTVALLFLSQTGDRAEAVRDCFKKFLGAHSNNRICYWAASVGGRLRSS
jgi:hypothetical protein